MPRLGRPRLPDADRRDRRLVVLLTPAEQDAVERAAEPEHPVAWARRVLVEATRSAAGAARSNGKRRGA